MFIAIIIGFVAGLTEIISLLFQQYLNDNGISSQFFSYWVVVPIGLSLLSLSYKDQLTEGLPDLLEEFHFGIQRSTSIRWIIRSVTSFIGIVFGSFFGTEGFIMEAITSILQSLIGRFPKYFQTALQHDNEARQILVVATVSSAMCIALGTPFAAAIFAMELLSAGSSRIRAAAFGASLSAYGIMRLFFHLSASMTSLSLVLVNGEKWGVSSLLASEIKVMVLGHKSLITLMVASGFLGILMCLLPMLVYWIQNYLKSESQKKSISGKAFVLLGGSVLAALWILTPVPFLDSGLQNLSRPLDSALLKMTVVFVVARFSLLTIANTAFGVTGILTPLMIWGVSIGALIGGLLNLPSALLLGLIAPSAVMGGAFGAPIAALAFTLEVSRDNVFMGMSLVGIISAMGLFSLCRMSNVPALILLRRGIRLVGGRCTNVLASLVMGDAMIRDFGSVSENSSVAEIQKASALSPYNVIGVHGEDGLFRGILALDQLPNNIDLKGINTKDLLDRDATTVTASEPLEKAFELLTNVPALAVLDENRRLIGLVFKSGVQARYQREIGRRALNYYSQNRKPFRNY